MEKSRGRVLPHELRVKSAKFDSAELRMGPLLPRMESFACQFFVDIGQDLDVIFLTLVFGQGQLLLWVAARYARSALEVPQLNGIGHNASDVVGKVKKTPG